MSDGASRAFPFLVDLSIPSLGPCEIPSPLHHIGSSEAPFRSEGDRSHTRDVDTDGMILSFEEAGPREKIFFDPARTTVGILICVGLCPGLNDIIRGIVNQCHFQYGITRVYGFRYGYEGLVQRYGDIGLFLKDRINAFFKERRTEVNLK